MSTVRVTVKARYPWWYYVKWANVPVIFEWKPILDPVAYKDMKIATWKELGIRFVKI